MQSSAKFLRAFNAYIIFGYIEINFSDLRLQLFFLLRHSMSRVGAGPQKVYFQGSMETISQIVGKQMLQNESAWGF